MVSIKHKKVVSIPDDPAAAAAGLVVSSDWNNVLDFKTAAALILLGRKSAGAGDVEELTASEARTLLDLVPGLAAGNILRLDGSGKVDASVLPSIAITEPFEVGSQSAMLALTAQQGDIAIRTDLSRTFILATNSPSTLADWKELRTPTDVVLAVAGLTGTITAAALKTALAMTAGDITDLSANGRSLVKAADYTAMRTLLGLVVGANVQAYSSLLAAIAGLTPTNGNVITGNGTTWTSAAPTGSAPPTMIVRDEKPSGTDGGSSSATTWNERTQNTVVANTISGASLSSNRVTLPAGTYDADASAPALLAGAHKLRLYNITDASPLFVGENALVPSGPITSASLTGRFTISGAKTIALEHYTAVARATDGLGKAVSAASTIEVYATLTLRKVS